jgi:hypothetical protein
VYLRQEQQASSPLQLAADGISKVGSSSDMSMDLRQISERLQYFQGIAAKHGYRAVPASKVYEAFEATAQPARLGFSAIKTALYGRVVNDDIVHLVKLQALKGASYSICWGVSLSYLPHRWSTSLRWHRSFKTSRFDLFETPHDYFPAATADWREGEKYVAHTQYGESYLRENLQVLWEQLGGEILDWFSATQSLAGVLEQARQQVERKRTGPQHHPHPLMVYAFTLGRMGRAQEAKTSLGEFFQLDRVPPPEQANLAKALHRISAG